FSLSNLSQVPIHVVGTNPVAVVDFGDNGYPVPATNGKFSGTDFFAYVGTFHSFTCDSTNFNVTSYQNNTRYTIRDIATNATVAQGVLEENGIRSILISDCREHFYEVTSSNDVSVSTRPYAVGGFYGNQLADHGGTLIGNDFLDVQGATGTLSNPFAYAIAYYDNTIVKAQEVAYSDGTVPNPPPVQVFTLNDGQFFNFAPKPFPSGLNGLNSGGGGLSGFDQRGRLYRVRSTRPIPTISFETSPDQTTTATGGSAPLFFGNNNLPDLTVASQ